MYFQFGDAPVHSLAAALFLKPREIHHFQDFGYAYSNLWRQPHNALGLQLPLMDLGRGKLGERGR
jgi:mannosyltransferase